MANLRQIKDRITGIQNTQKITRAMKMVAAAKIKKAENAVRASRPFTLELYKMFCWVWQNAVNVKLRKINTENSLDNYPALLENREINTVGIVIISSNKGLAGAYSANIIRYSINLIKKLNEEGKKVCVYFVGQKAIPALKNVQKELGFEIKKTYIDILNEIDSTGAYRVASKLAKDYINKEIDAIELVTTRYKNMMTYSTESWQLLPVVSKERCIKDFRNKELDEELKIEHKAQTITPLSEFLPNLSEVLAQIVPMYITNIIFQALQEAQASELASRMTAMGAACSNASDMIVNLTIEYNKERQAKITQEITEIISGAGALK